jgi:hypothetical protein
MGAGYATQLGKRSGASQEAQKGMQLLINRVQNEFMQRNSPPAIMLLEECLKLDVAEGEAVARQHLFRALSGNANVRTAWMHGAR